MTWSKEYEWLISQFSVGCLGKAVCSLPYRSLEPPKHPDTTVNTKKTKGKAGKGKSSDACDEPEPKLDWGTCKFQTELEITPQEAEWIRTGNHY